jgi:membrane protein
VLATFRLHLTLYELARRTIKGCVEDDVLNLAAELGYYFMFALFPALLCVVAIASFFPLQHFTDDVVQMLGPVLPSAGLTIIKDQMLRLAEGKNGGLLSLGVLAALWTTAVAMVGVIDALNRAYHIDERRPWWRVRMTAILLTIAMAFFIVISFTLVVAGPQLADKLANSFGLGEAFSMTWKVAQWPIVFGLVSFGIGLVYFFAPDAEQDWVWVTPGSIVATLLWLLVSIGFRVYVVHFGNYDAMYGAIGAAIVLMTWLYLSGLVIVVGAEMNAQIEEASPWAKAAHEKQPAERRKIGAAAERAYHEARRRYPRARRT